MTIKLLTIAAAALALGAAAHAQQAQQQPPQALPTGLQFLQQENAQLSQQLSVKTGMVSQLLEEVASQKKRYDDCVADPARCKADRDKAEQEAKVAREKAEQEAKAKAEADKKKAAEAGKKPG